VYRWGGVLLCVAGAGLDSGGRGWPGQRAMESFRSRTGQVMENRQSGRWTKINRQNVQWWNTEQLRSFLVEIEIPLILQNEGKYIVGH
jgi:hypothetical protein